MIERAGCEEGHVEKEWFTERNGPLPLRWRGKPSTVAARQVLSASERFDGVGRGHETQKEQRA